MSRKPETKVKNRVNEIVAAAGVYNQSMYTPYSAGTPDHYYEGQHACLWIEWKRVPKFTLKCLDPAELCSALQVRWIKRARLNGCRAWVVVGDDAGHYIMWWDCWAPLHPIDDLWLTKHEVANHIVNATGRSHDLRDAAAPTSRPRRSVSRVSTVSPTTQKRAKNR